MISVAFAEDLAAHIGETVSAAETFQVTGDLVDAFSAISEDGQWIHRADAAQRIVPGNLLITLLPKHIQQNVQVTNFSRCLTVKYESVRFKKPVLVGMTVLCSIRIQDVLSRAVGTYVSLEVTLKEAETQEECLTAEVTDYYETGSPQTSG